MAVLAITDGAHAQPSEAVTTTEERAAVAFERGKRAFEEDDYASALASFEEAQRLAPHDVVRFNIALCLERLGRFSRALGEYERAAASTQLDGASREDATQRARRVAGRLGTVVIEGPPGAHVEVEGAGACTAPCRIAVDPGVVQVRRTDAPGAATTVTIVRGGERVVSFRASDGPDRATDSAAGPRLGVLGWIGGGAAVVGLVGTVAFGVHAQALHDEYDGHPTRERYDDGRRAVVLTNVSIGLAVVGAALVVVDLLVLGRPVAAAPDGGAVAVAF